LEDAERILSDARSRTDAVRAEAASLRLVALEEERATLDAHARAEADRVRRVADLHTPEIVSRVLAGVWETAGLPPAPAVKAPVEVRG
jgi:hypothetical protein